MPSLPSLEPNVLAGSFCGFAGGLSVASELSVRRENSAAAADSLISRELGFCLDSFILVTVLSTAGCARPLQPGIASHFSVHHELAPLPFLHPPLCTIRLRRISRCRHLVLHVAPDDARPDSNLPSLLCPSQLLQLLLVLVLRVVVERESKVLRLQPRKRLRHLQVLLTKQMLRSWI